MAQRLRKHVTKSLYWRLNLYPAPCLLTLASSQKDNLSVGVKSYFIFTKKQTKYNKKKKVTKDLFEVLLLRIFKKFRNEEDKQLCSRTNFEVKVIILYDE